MDEDRDAALDREREDRLEALVAECERLGTGMQLDAACAEVERAELPPPAVGEVEPDERDEPSLERAAWASVLSFGTVNAGSRSCSSRQNMNAPSKSKRSRTDESSS